MFSVYSFWVGQVQSQESGRKQAALEDRAVSIEGGVSALNKSISGLPGAVPEPADFNPIKASFDPVEEFRFNDNLTFSRRYTGLFDSSVSVGAWQEKGEWLLRNDPNAVAHIWFMQFTVESQSDRNFTQVAPYLVVEVASAQPLPDDLAFVYEGGRGGAALVREFRGSIPAEPGVYFAPWIDRQTQEANRSADYFSLMPREPEMFSFSLNIDSGFLYEMRVGVHYRYQEKHRIHWVTPFFRNGIPGTPLPGWDFADAFPVQLHPDAEGDDPAATQRRAREGAAFANGGKLFRPDQIVFSKPSD
ncbi:hypothetical protein KCG44_14165 [Pacificimonas sp. WHA3]|uniref:Uncharacterized protein n=1 Tax=Pacificimonas pallii TaxID=2827236 RepID=A0ABS6SJ82_9SPHN|nr:hypothetical protein [Pacificimonas pallii]MBV7257927.1 hypothetical protein [Pacificimonas pallii]